MGAELDSDSLRFWNVPDDKEALITEAVRKKFGADIVPDSGTGTRDGVFTIRFTEPLDLSDDEIDDLSEWFNALLDEHEVTGGAHPCY